MNGTSICTYVLFSLAFRLHDFLWLLSDPLKCGCTIERASSLELRGATVSQANQHIQYCSGLHACVLSASSSFNHNDQFCRQPCAEPVVDPFNRCFPPFVFLLRVICKITSCLIFYYLTIQPASKIQQISLLTRYGTACRAISDLRVLQLHIEILFVTPSENLS